MTTPKKLKRKPGMKFLAAMALGLAGFAAPLVADETTDLLTSGPWKISGSDWSAVCTFNKDGSFNPAGSAAGSGKWEVKGAEIELTYRDGRKETLKLPLNAKGTAGNDGDGNAIFAFLTQQPVVAAPGPAAAAPVPSPAAGKPIDLLMSGEWRIVGMNGQAFVRTFYENGTFTTAEPMSGEKGTWSMDDRKLELIFIDGHTETFQLPLNPTGTAVFDQAGNPLIAFLDKTIASSEASHPPPVPEAANPPATPPGGPGDEATIEMLTAGPWKIWGTNWSAMRVFRRNGTFMSQTNAKEYGRWKIGDGRIEMQYIDGHVDSLTLPLNPKATLGMGSNGLGTMACLTANTSAIAAITAVSAPPPTKPATATGSTPVMTAPMQTLPGDTAGILSAGPWKVQGPGFNAAFTFYRDGSVAWQGSNTAKWHVDGKSVVVDFAGEPIIISLPLNARGTLASRWQGGGLAVMTTANNFRQDAHNSPHLDLGGAAVNVPVSDTVAWLTAGPWRFSGVDWSGDKNFKPDGTFLSFEKNRGQGTWKVVGGNVEMTFDDGRKETIFGPMDPRGTVGIDASELGMIGFQMGPKTVANLPQKLPFPTPPPSAHPTPGIPVARGPHDGGEFGFPVIVVGGGGGPGSPPSEPLSAEMQQKAADLVKAYNASLVFVKGKEGAGSGFIATMDGKNFLITNAHVAAGIRDAKFKDVDDDELKPGPAAVAVGRDLYSMGQPAGGKPLEVMDKVGENAAIGDEVVVLGNAEGQGVINLITGRITGIGGDRIEVDAPFVPGNSGSPIIHIKSGKVIGVATYSFIRDYDPTTQVPTFRPVIRRFGFRLDNVKQWEAVDPRTFGAQASGMEGIEAMTEDLLAVCKAFAGGMRGISPEEFTSPAVKNCVAQWAKATEGRHSMEERKQAAVDLFSALRNAAQVDVTLARSQMTYDYFKGELAEQQEYRDALVKVFDAAVKSAGN